MTVRARCPNLECGQKYRVSDSHVGRRVACRKCGRQFRLTEAAEDTAEGASPDEITLHPVEPRPEAPTRLGRFEVRCRLGAGAFGVVYRAYDPLLDREVALKVPHAGRLETDKDKARFVREAKAAAKLRHPNVVPVYEAGVQDGRHYLASAFIEGQTLQVAIEQGRPDFQRSARLVRDLAGALFHAHRQGVVHRDIKPANIILDGNGDPLVMDFGLARFQEGAEKLTHDGTLLGTPAYMSPEQAMGKLDEVGPASDQYSLGVVLYELLCGETPFSGPPPLVISHVINQEPPRPRVANATIPRDLETICLKAMAKRPENRYTDCGELAEDLRRWESGEVIRARRVGPVERLVRWSRRNPALATLSAAVAILLMAVALVATVAYTRTSRALAREAVSRQAAEAERQGAERQSHVAEAERQRAQENEQTAKEKERIANEALAKLKLETEARSKAESERLREMQQRLKLAEEVKQKDAQITVAAAALDRVKKGVVATGEARTTIHWLRYIEHLVAADKAYQENNAAPALELLEACPEEDRAWEWYYLKSLCKGLRPTTRQVSALQLWPSSVSSNVEWICTGRSSGEHARHDEMILQMVNRSFRDLSPTSSCKLTFAKFGGDMRVALSPDGTNVLFQKGYRSCGIFDASRGERIAPFSGFGDPLPFSPDGKFLLGFQTDARSLTDTTILFALQTQKAIAAPKPVDRAVHHYTTFTINGQLAGTGTSQRRRATIETIELCEIDAEGNRKLPPTSVDLQLDWGEFKPFLSPDGRFVALLSTADRRRDRLQQLFVCQVKPPRRLSDLPETAVNVSLLSFSPDGKRLALGDKSGLHIWNIVNGKQLPDLRSLPWTGGKHAGVMAIDREWTRAVTTASGELLRWWLDAPIDTSPAKQSETRQSGPVKQ